MAGPKGLAGVTATGQDKVEAKLRQLSTKYGAAIPAALYRQGEKIMATSKRSYVPIDEGTLKRSGKVFPPEVRGREISVLLAFGDSATPYAIAIHEHPSPSSPPSWKGKVVKFSPAGTGAKYLEKPLLAALPTLGADIAADLIVMGV